jgi:hypothetical protein
MKHPKKKMKRKKKYEARYEALLLPWFFVTYAKKYIYNLSMH